MKTLNRYRITYLRGTPSIIVEAVDEQSAKVAALAEYRKSRCFVDPMPLEKIVLKAEKIAE